MPATMYADTPALSAAWIVALSRSSVNSTMGRGWRALTNDSCSSVSRGRRIAVDDDDVGLHRRHAIERAPAADVDTSDDVVACGLQAFLQ